MSSHAQDEENEQRTEGSWEALRQYAMSNKIQMALWITRGLTILFCFSYILPIFSNPYSSYQKAVISSAASSALRLHQRIPHIQFTREFFGTFIMEDSAHYLFYSIIFMYTTPITMVLVPIFLFALLHFASFTVVLLDVAGRRNAAGAKYLISFVELQQRNMLRGAAFVEIILMPLFIVSIFTGKVGLLTPFIYFRFLTMRYASRRNTYTRTMFYESRLTTEYLVNREVVPQIVKNIVYRSITFISSLAPAQIPQPQQ